SVACPRDPPAPHAFPTRRSSDLATAQTTGSASSPKSLKFDVAQVPATRDSFVFRLRGQERGWAVWQYEIRQLEMTQEVIYTAARSEEHTSELQSLRHLVCRLLLE